MDKWIVLSSSIFLIGGISWFFFGKKDKSESSDVEEFSGEERVELNITGMHCAGCAAGIEGTIRSLPGVKSAQVNFATSKGVFVIDPKKVTREQIVQKIKELGYDAAPDIESLEKKS